MNFKNIITMEPGKHGGKPCIRGMCMTLCSSRRPRRRLQMLETRQPKTLKVCALLDKPERCEAHVPIHYLGFTIPNKFVFGYGLDLDEYYRNLPFVGVVDLNKYKPLM